jgi:hypothetical protein
MAIHPERSARLSRACNTAHSKCKALLSPIMKEVRALSRSGLWEYDACGLSKPIYSVAALIARSPNLGTMGDFLVCLKVLQQTRWVYSDHEKKVADLRFLWNVSRDKLLDEPSKPQKRSLRGSYPISQGSPPTGYTSRPPMTASPPSPSPPFSPVFRPSSPVKSVRSRGSSGNSCCISEGHNSPDDDGPSRKSPSRLARFLSRLEKGQGSGRVLDGLEMEGTAW